MQKILAKDVDIRRRVTFVEAHSAKENIRADAIVQDNTILTVFREGLHYLNGWKNDEGEMIGMDLDKAEDLLIKALRSDDQIESAVLNLVSVYVLKGRIIFQRASGYWISMGIYFLPKKEQIKGFS